jgi:hypothetical protein
MVLTIAKDAKTVDWSNLVAYKPIAFYGENMNGLCGVLFVSFFVHNVVRHFAIPPPPRILCVGPDLVAVIGQILPIMKSQRNPRTSDLGSCTLLPSPFIS